MDALHRGLLTALVFLAATLYASVGHAGASAYLAAMALMGLTPETMRPTALVLNIMVATLGTVRFHRAGLCSWKLLWPFALGAVPLAFVGGSLTLPGSWYKALVGAVLLVAAVRLARSAPVPVEAVTRPAPRGLAVACGAVIGLLSGLTGTGGGIMLTPLLLFCRWAGARQAAGVSVAFILLNSIAGLAGRWRSLEALPPYLPELAVAALTGGLLGSELGTRRLPVPALRRLLALVLAIAGLKLVMMR